MDCLCTLSINSRLFTGWAHTQLCVCTPCECTLVKSEDVGSPKCVARKCYIEEALPMFITNDSLVTALAKGAADQGSRCPA